MQLADVPGRHEPGTGEIGWDCVFRRIDELGYTGWIGCEYNPAGGAQLKLPEGHFFVSPEGQFRMSFDSLPYGKTPSTPKMRCVAYLLPIATACL
jgi:sugar phosphate isomerase/epimerase